MDERMYAHGPYRYITKHGIGPGTLPKDVKLVKYEDLDDFYTAIWTDRFLTTRELEQYDIFPETIQDPADIPKDRINIFESLNDEDITKLSSYKLNDEDLSHLLSLFELISDENKAKAFEIVDALLSGKELIATVNECINPRIDELKSKSEKYTRRLLGN